MSKGDSGKNVNNSTTDNTTLTVNSAGFSLPSSSRSDNFLESLYREKEIHKEHRHKHVIQKLLLTSSFFGLGQFVRETSLLSLLLYAVPLIAVVHDIYIFAEHEKIRRVGDFIKDLGSKGSTSVCPEEIAWENFATDHREKRALVGSLAYTLIISAFSAAAIVKFNPSVIRDSFFLAWIVVVVLAVIVVFAKGYIEIKVQISKKM